MDSQSPEIKIERSKKKKLQTVKITNQKGNIVLINKRSFSMKEHSPKYVYKKNSHKSQDKRSIIDSPSRRPNYLMKSQYCQGNNVSYSPNFRPNRFLHPSPICQYFENSPIFPAMKPSKFNNKNINVINIREMQNDDNLSNNFFNEIYSGNNFIDDENSNVNNNEIEITDSIFSQNFFFGNQNMDNNGNNNINSMYNINSNQNMLNTPSNNNTTSNNSNLSSSQSLNNNNIMNMNINSNIKVLLSSKSEYDGSKAQNTNTKKVKFANQNDNLFQNNTNEENNDNPQLNEVTAKTKLTPDGKTKSSLSNKSFNMNNKIYENSIFRDLIDEGENSSDSSDTDIKEGGFLNTNNEQIENEQKSFKNTNNITNSNVNNVNANANVSTSNSVSNNFEMGMMNNNINFINNNNYQNNTMFPFAMNFGGNPNTMMNNNNNFMMNKFPGLSMNSTYMNAFPYDPNMRTINYNNYNISNLNNINNNFYINNQNRNFTNEMYQNYKTPNQVLQGNLQNKVSTPSQISTNQLSNQPKNQTSTYTTASSNAKNILNLQAPGFKPQIPFQYPKQNIQTIQPVVNSQSFLSPTNPMNQLNQMNPQMLQQMNLNQINQMNLIKISNQNFSSLSDSDLAKNSHIISKYQSGCRFLQKKLDDNPDLAQSLFFPYILERITEFATDPFGHFFLKKVISFLPEEKILQIITMIYNDFTQIANNQFGARVLQVILDHLKSEENINLFVKILVPNLNIYINDPNANYLVHKALLCNSKYDMEIIDYIVKNISEIAANKKGCVFIQKCLESLTGNKLEMIITAIENNLTYIITNQYGNYIIQNLFHVIPNVDLKMGIYKKIITNLEFYSNQKYSSNVVEKCYDFQDVGDMFFEPLLKDDLFKKLMLNSFGNYVAQKAVLKCSDEIKDKLFDVLVEIAPQLQQITYGQKLISKLLIQYPKFAIKMVSTNNSFNNGNMGSKNITGNN